MATKRALSFFAGLLLAGPALAGQSWFADGEEGWFWYEDPLLAEEPPKEPPPKEPAPAVERYKKKEQQAAAAPSVPAGPPVFSAAWLRENQKVYLDRAIDNPTPENVTAYFMIQRVMMDRAEQFATVASRVTRTNTLLDENGRMPTSTAGSQMASKIAIGKKRRLLAEVAKQGGIVYFFEADCPLCKNQEPLLQAMERNYSFEVLPVSRTGEPTHTGGWEKYRTDKGEAVQLGIQTYPSLYLAIPGTNALYPIASGFVAADQLEDRILYSAVEAGIVSERALKQTQPGGTTRSLHLEAELEGWEGTEPPPAEFIIRALTDAAGLGGAL